MHIDTISCSRHVPAVLQCRRAFPARPMSLIGDVLRKHNGTRSISLLHRFLHGSVNAVDVDDVGICTIRIRQPEQCDDEIELLIQDANYDATIIVVSTWFVCEQGFSRCSTRVIFRHALMITGSKSKCVKSIRNPGRRIAIMHLAGIRQQRCWLGNEIQRVCEV